jgi:AMMECR1 domain-containing protein
MLFAGCRSATFLPQVWEQLPAPADFLAALKRKAGMAVERPVDGLMAARYGVRKWRESERPSDDPAQLQELQ